MTKITLVSVDSDHSNYMLHLIPPVSRVSSLEYDKQLRELREKENASLFYISKEDKQAYV